MLSMQMDMSHCYYTVIMLTVIGLTRLIEVTLVRFRFIKYSGVVCMEMIINTVKLLFYEGLFNKR